MTEGRVTDGPEPVPVSAIDCGELGASSLTTMEPARKPSPEGEKITLSVQLALGTRRLPRASDGDQYTFLRIRNRRVGSGDQVAVRVLGEAGNFGA